MSYERKSQFDDLRRFVWTLARLFHSQMANNHYKYYGEAINLCLLE